ncbi:dTDP-4-dehydrorhamnose reductase [Asticcacaulis sp.]|uniref:dTDP-4-dehydrorhamnose reductase n=1 Tax=Asticcacaulis sp. TaxID=1872648 RepID=UPI003F7B3892
MMRILVTGKNGQVDTALQIEGERLGLEIVRIGRPDVDLSKPETIETAVREIRPEVIISSAAYTAVDKAESEPELAQAVNGDAPGVLARLAAELDIPILHLSTDCVFSGDKDEPYTELDTPAPISVYGRTKLSGEEQVRAATDNHVILRISWVYSSLGSNFVKMMLHLSETRGEVTVVADQLGCPTYAPEAARAVLAIAQQVVIDPDPTIRGTFHLAGEGEATRADFAKAIFKGAGARGHKPVHVNPIATADYPTAAKRPLNARLNSDKLDEVFGLRLEPWQDSLDVCLDELIITGR